jgi:hypothetical protein
MAEPKMQIWMMQMEERVAKLTTQLEFLNQAVKHLSVQQQGMQAAPAPRSGAPSPSPYGSYKIKPAPPLDLSEDWAKGRAFLNSCKLYMQLAGEQFPGEEEKISWAYSYMKSGQAALFIDRML